MKVTYWWFIPPLSFPHHAPSVKCHESGSVLLFLAPCRHRWRRFDFCGQGESTWMSPQVKDCKSIASALVSKFNVVCHAFCRGEDALEGMVVIAWMQLNARIMCISNDYHLPVFASIRSTIKSVLYIPIHPMCWQSRFFFLVQLLRKNGENV